jgi:hypothetical protein
MALATSYANKDIKISLESARAPMSFETIMNM